MYNFIITNFDYQGGNQDGDVSVMAFAHAHFLGVPELNKFSAAIGLI